MFASPHHPRNRVARAPTGLDSVVTAMLDWGVRLAIMGAFSFTLAQLRGLVNSFLTSKFNLTLNSIFKLRNAFRCLSPKDVVTSVVCPKDFRAQGALRSTLDAIKTGFTNFANTKNPLALATALKQIKNLRDIKFDKDQILRMQIQARFQLPVCVLTRRANNYFYCTSSLCFLPARWLVTFRHSIISQIFCTMHERV